MLVPFTKMHGCGNDYIYVNAMQHHISDPSDAAIKWSDRHKGVGSDGLVLIDRSPVCGADFSMRIFNADGSEAMMCGNASRCIGKYLFDRKLTDKHEIRLFTLSGIKTLRLHVTDGMVEGVTVDMGMPVMEEELLFRRTAGLPAGTFVSMGNPHYVVFTDDVNHVETMGESLEYNDAFPQRCNIEFAHIMADGSIRVRVWERGSGITQACGTGACAVAVAAYANRLSARHCTVVMDGGELCIEWSEADGHVYMTGPAEFVFDGEIDYK